MILSTKNIQLNWNLLDKVKTKEKIYRKISDVNIFQMRRLSKFIYLEKYYTISGHPYLFYLKSNFEFPMEIRKKAIRFWEVIKTRIPKLLAASVTLNTTLPGSLWMGHHCGLLPRPRIVDLAQPAQNARVSSPAFLSYIKRDSKRAVDISNLPL